MNTLHRVLLKLSGGKIGWTAGKMPVLRLTTTGRKSGEARSVMLTSPVQEGTTIVIVASRGGDENHPAWFLNLRDNPSVKVSFKGQASNWLMGQSLRFESEKPIPVEGLAPAPTESRNQPNQPNQPQGASPRFSNEAIVPTEPRNQPKMSLGEELEQINGVPPSVPL